MHRVPYSPDKARNRGLNGLMRGALPHKSFVRAICRRVDSGPHGNGWHRPWECMEQIWEMLPLRGAGAGLKRDSRVIHRFSTARIRLLRGMPKSSECAIKHFWDFVARDIFTTA